MSGPRYERVGAADEEAAAGGEAQQHEQELHEGQQPTVVVVEREENGDEGSDEALPVASEVVEPADAITVKVKSADEKTHELRVSASESVAGLKSMLEERTGLPVARQRLIALGRMLEDSKTLKESNVKDGNFVHLVPKPEAACMSRATSGGSADGRGLNEINIPAHIQEMLAARGELHTASMTAPGGRRSQLSFEEEYELNIWRYRVRVMSMLMLFYYFMALMASVSLWLHPDDKDEYQQQGQFRQVRSDVALSLVDTLENLLGIMVSVVGLKTAISFDTRLSKKFAREMSVLAVVHFANLFMWIRALVRGEIVQVPVHHRYASHDNPQEDIRQIISAMLIVHPMIWLAMLSIAYRFHKLLQYRLSVLNPPQATPANNDDGDGLDEPIGVATAV